MSEDTLTALYRMYGPIIYARCVRLLGDRAAAEDAIQETFMRVQRHLHKVPSADEALTWIYRIATNYCLNEIRDRRLRPRSEAELPERGRPATVRDGVLPSLRGGDLPHRAVTAGQRIPSRPVR